MKFFGYESYTSWIITIGSLIINCTSHTPYRIVGLLYVSIVDYYETDRGTASIPILTFTIVRCLGGPFCGVLGEKFGAENVTLYGSILAAVGFGGCIFAKNILGLVILLGLIFGLGMTGSNTLLPSILKKYFNRNFNTANGISQAGPCLGAILIPPLAVFLLDKYSLPGMFLITSALMLHALPICLIIKKAGLIQDEIIENTKKNTEHDNKEQLCTNNQKLLPVPEETNVFVQNAFNQKFLSDSVKNTCILDQSMKFENNNQKSFHNSAFNAIITNESEQMSNNKQKQLPISFNELLRLREEDKCHKFSSDTSCAIYNNLDDASCQKIHYLHNYVKETDISDLKNNIVLKSQEFNSDYNTTDINKTSLIPEVKEISNIQLEKDAKEQIITTLCEIRLKNPSEGSPISNDTELNKSASPKQSKFHYFKVFLNPHFLIIMLCTGLHNFVSVLSWTTMIDYSRDKGVPREYEVYFLMIHPFCEILGRVCFGWVTDLGYLSMFKYSVLCFSLMGLTSGCVLVSVDFWTMMLGALTFAIACGCMTAIFPGMVFSYVPEKLQTMAIASRYALSGPLIFTSAPLIGFFREKQGSYDGVYILFIAICGLCAAVMILMSKFSSHCKKTVIKE